MKIKLQHLRQTYGDVYIVKFTHFHIENLFQVSYLNNPTSHLRKYVNHTTIKMGIAIPENVTVVVTTLSRLVILT